MHHKTHEAAKKLFAPGWFFQIYPTMINICLLFLGTISELSFVQPWHHGGKLDKQGKPDTLVSQRNQNQMPRCHALCRDPPSPLRRSALDISHKESPGSPFLRCGSGKLASRDSQSNYAGFVFRMSFINPWIYCHPIIIIS